MNYYDEIKENLLKSEIFDRVHDYVKDKNKVSVYFEVGKLLSAAGKEYGKNIIKQYSEKLMIDVGKKYNVSTLYRMKKYYELFSNSKLAPLAQVLSWSHYMELLALKNVDEIIYYINICRINKITKRDLREKIKYGEYVRLSQNVKNKLTNQDTLEIYDLIPNPIVIKNNTQINILTEYALKELILNNIDSFLSELGVGFTYVGSEYKIKLGNTYNYIDLLLYNIDYSCYVVIELKVTELKKEHIGQIQVYMNYIDKNVKKINHDKTIGIIICKKDNKYVVEYCSDSRIISRVYELV